MKLYTLAGMSTATTGTGTMTLGAAVAGHLTFEMAGVPDGEEVTYALVDGDNSEVGRGIYTASGTTLTRASILRSTNSNNAINLSGSAKVYITPSAEDLESQMPGLMAYVSAQANGSGTGAGENVGLGPEGITLSMQTGTTATGVFSHRWCSSGFGVSVSQPMGAGVEFSASVRFPTLSDASEEYTLEHGFTDSWAFGTVGASGIYFLYDRAGSGANWRCVTRSSSVSTNTDSGVAVAANTKQKLRIEIESATKVKFYIDNVLVATNTTNIPTLTNSISLVSVIRKSVGTTSRIVHLGRVKYHRET